MTYRRRFSNTNLSLLERVKLVGDYDLKILYSECNTLIYATNTKSSHKKTQNIPVLQITLSWILLRI